MSTTRTGPQIKADYMSAMGQELGQVFYCLYNECNWLHWKWNEYKTLFAGKPEHLQLFNDVAPGLAYVMEYAQWNDLLMHLCRLTDPAISMGKQNLTIQHLNELVHAQVRDEVKRLTATACSRCGFAKTIRNRSIAHLDHGFATGVAGPIPGGTIAQVQAAIDAISELLNFVEGHYCRSTVAYGSFPLTGGADRLLLHMEKGRKALAAEMCSARTRPTHPDESSDSLR